MVVMAQPRNQLELHATLSGNIGWVHGQVQSSVCWITPAWYVSELLYINLLSLRSALHSWWVVFSSRIDPCSMITAPLSRFGVGWTQIFQSWWWQREWQHTEEKYVTSHTMSLVLGMQRTIACTEFKAINSSVESYAEVTLSGCRIAEVSSVVQF